MQNYQQYKQFDNLEDLRYFFNQIKKIDPRVNLNPVLDEEAFSICPLLIKVLNDNEKQRNKQIELYQKQKQYQSKEGFQSKKNIQLEDFIYPFILIPKIETQNLKSLDNTFFQEEKFHRLFTCNKYQQDYVLTIEEDKKEKKVGNLYSKNVHICPKKGDILHLNNKGNVLGIQGKLFQKCYGFCKLIGAQRYCLGQQFNCQNQAFLEQKNEKEELKTFLTYDFPFFTYQQFFNYYRGIDTFFIQNLFFLKLIQYQTDFTEQIIQFFVKCPFLIQQAAIPDKNLLFYDYFTKKSKLFQNSKKEELFKLFLGIFEFKRRQIFDLSQIITLLGLFDPLTLKQFVQYLFLPFFAPKTLLKTQTFSKDGIFFFINNQNLEFLKDFLLFDIFDENYPYLLVIQDIEDKQEDKYFYICPQLSQQQVIDVLDQLQIFDQQTTKTILSQIDYFNETISKIQIDEKMQIQLSDEEGNQSFKINIIQYKNFANQFKANNIIFSSQFFNSFKLFDNFDDYFNKFLNKVKKTKLNQIQFNVKKFHSQNCIYPDENAQVCNLGNLCNKKDCKDCHCHKFEICELCLKCSIQCRFFKSNQRFQKSCENERCFFCHCVTVTK